MPWETLDDPRLEVERAITSARRLLKRLREVEREVKELLGDLANAAAALEGMREQEPVS